MIDFFFPESNEALGSKEEVRVKLADLGNACWTVSITLICLAASITTDNTCIFWYLHNLTFTASPICDFNMYHHLFALLLQQMFDPMT